MFGVIYEIKNLVNGKRYIGLTRLSAQKRWRQHVCRSRNKPSTYLHSAIAKYGEKNFEVTEIASCLSRDFLGELERVIIVQEKPEYNQTSGGEVTFGRKYSDEVIEIIRQKNTGRKLSDESRKRISGAKRRLYLENPELKKKSSDWIKANRHKWEQKRIEAVRKASTGRKMPEPHKERLREISKTRIRSSDEVSRMIASKTKKVKCETDGRIYASRHEAASEYGVSEKSVWRACNGKCGPVKGLKFSYLETQT